MPTEIVGRFVDGIEQAFRLRCHGRQAVIKLPDCAMVQLSIRIQAMHNSTVTQKIAFILESAKICHKPRGCA